MNSEAEPRSEGQENHYERFTFPNDNPVKHIDFNLFRGKDSVRECKTIGQTPTEDTRAFPQDVGMLDHKTRCTARTTLASWLSSLNRVKRWTPVKRNTHFCLMSPVII